MTSPTMRRKALGHELRELRLQADYSVEETAALLGCSVAKVGHIENGRNAPSKPELMVLMEHYQVSGEARKVLEETRREASKRGWWSTYRLPRWLANYVGMETDASRVRNFELELIPGLLQTEDYSRAIHILGRHVLDPNEVDRRVSARTRRQERLHQDPPLELEVVLSESALRRCAENQDVSEGQFDHLIAMACLPSITLQVLPFGQGLHESMSGSFHLLDFPADTWPPTAYQEYAVGGHLVDDQDVIHSLDRLFGELQDQSLSTEDSIQLIASYRPNRG